MLNKAYIQVDCRFIRARRTKGRAGSPCDWYELIQDTNTLSCKECYANYNLGKDEEPWCITDGVAEDRILC